MPKFPFELPCDASDEVVRVCNEMWDVGYAKIGCILNFEEARSLRELINPMMKECRPWTDRWTKFDSNEYFLPPFGDNDQIMLSNIAARDARLDELLEKILTNETLKESLSIILGNGYKAWELSARRSNATDQGLRMHEDAVGEFGISVLLNNQTDAYGTTSLMPRSHRSRVSCRDAGVEDYLRPSIMKLFSHPITGSAGDVFFFFKKTWHGRVQSKRMIPSDCLLFGLFPTGYRFKPFQIPLAEMQKLPNELRRLLRIDEGFNIEDDGYFRVVGDNSDKRMIDLIYQKQYAVNSIWDMGPLIKPTLDNFRSLYKKLRSGERRSSPK